MANIETKILENSIAVITINRPGHYNALNMAAMAELKDALAALAADEALRCLLITGAGEKAFVAGADTRELAALDRAGALELSRNGSEVFLRVQNFPVPVIAAINGFALGGGCELALSCDIRIAAATASLGLPETSLGIIPGWGGTQRLPRLIGYGPAAAMIFTGAKVKAQRALELGLVNAVTEPESLMEEALALARQIANNAPLAVRAVKKIMLAGREKNLTDGISLENETFAALFATEDKDKGLYAVNNKEKAVFAGK